jgi:diguanylate cyclase (GGDEF)-like protein
MEGTTPRAALRAMEALVGQFWTTLAEVCRGRSALSTDLTTGMLTRSAFLEEAERATEASYAHGEPVALVVIAMEGLRRLMDDGGWDACDGVAREVASTARYRIRPDDLIGRFDDSRFVLLLRRVDSELASLIARQLADQLSQLPLASALGADVAVRCGVSGSGSGRNPVASLLGEAVRMCHRARSESIQLASDVDRPAAVGGSGS